jgi:hypothetical protein
MSFRASTASGIVGVEKIWFASERLPGYPTFACTICDIRSHRWQQAAASVCR